MLHLQSLQWLSLESVVQPARGDDIDRAYWDSDCLGIPKLHNKNLREKGYRLTT